MRNQDPLEIVKDLWRSRRVKLLVILFGLLLLSGFGACTFRVCCVTFVDNYAIPYKFDTRTGEITKLDRVGYHIRTPLVEKIHSVDARPVQACVSAIQRVLNCKLVRFNEEGLDLFLEWHGRKNYSNDGGTPAAPRRPAVAGGGTGGGGGGAADARSSTRSSATAREFFRRSS